MRFEISQYSDYGTRAVNEDSVWVSQSNGHLLAMVADGLGGMGHGDMASRSAVETISGIAVANGVNETVLCEAVENANAEIRDMQKVQDASMMTTLALVWLSDDKSLAATVGDSRIYQFRNEQIVFQSVDHSVAQLAVENGEITSEQIRSFPGRNRILRAIGADEEVEIDCHALSVQPGDVFLLCSDGLWELVTESQMQEILRQRESAASIAGQLHTRVQESPDRKKDNNSAVVIRVYE